jgi:hypothetical protein
MVRTIVGKTKEGPKDTQPIGTKEGRELVPFMIQAISPTAFLMSSTCKS